MSTVFRRRLTPTLLALLLVCIGGCATSGYQRVQPEPLEQAATELPEESLLDVGVVISQAEELTRKQLDKQGTDEDIRRSECNYIPYHLKNTLQMSSYWGTVQVVPPEEDNFDLIVTSELVQSDGERILFKVEAKDATGKVWLKRNYEAKVDSGAYLGTASGEHDAFQDLYNVISNDLSEFQRTLTPEQTDQIRTVAKLKFAQDFAPSVYGDYLAEDGNGRYVIERLPSDDDPHMQRIAKIRERDHMFVDTLNQYYEGFYINMWDAYESWRRYNLAEQVAQRRIEQEAFWKTVAGIALIAAAVAMDIGDVGDTGALGGIMILGGGQILINGVNVSQQAKIHAEAIRELAASFGDEMRPTVIELEGKQYELIGTVSEQYEQWRELLHQIYDEETGFGSDTAALGPAGATPSRNPVAQ